MSLFKKSLCVSLFALLTLAQSFSPLSLSPQSKAVAADSKLLEPASVCEDAVWASGFGRAGVNGVITAMTTSGSDVYVVGSFSQAGNTIASRIAKWDGAKWTSPGGGLPLAFGEINAVAVIGSNIFVAGDSNPFDPTMRSGVIRWDGASWSFLPASANNGLTNSVSAMAVIGDDLYVAGLLYIEGMGLTQQPLLKWDGAAWSRIGENLEGFGDALAVSGDDIYLSGGIIIGESNANGIAKWDGVSWSPLGSGVSLDGSPGGVQAIATNGDDVYVGGNFTSAGGVSANYVAKWDGAGWSALGTGANNGVNFHSVYALAVNGNDVYVGGNFNVAGGPFGSGGVLAFNIAKWNGAGWSALGSGENNGVSMGQFTAVNAIAVGSGSVFVAGDFTKAAGANASYITRWSNGFSELGEGILNGLDGPVYAMAVIGSDVYVGGGFTTAGGVTVNHVARWDGTRWNAVGAGAIKGVNGQVNAMAVSGNNLYVGGHFNQAGGALAFGVAKWDGSNWSSFTNNPGFGLDGYVSGMAANGSDVYVCGVFDSVSGVPAKNVAMWNGTSWSALGGGLTSTFGFVTAFEVAIKGSDVYVGGVFDRAGGVTANGIARWDGANWHSLGGGVTSEQDHGWVTAMDFVGNDLYAGGSFDAAGGVSAKHIAVWDGAKWSALIAGPQNGVNAPVYAIKADESGVYVGGHLTSAGALSANGVAKWDGMTWTAFGSGTNGPPSGGFSGDVRSIGVIGPKLYVGGNFSIAGGKPSYHFAAWDRSILLSAVSQAFNTSGGEGRVSVNMPIGCSWDANSNHDWIIITSPVTNSGGGTVTYEVRENFNAQPRSGTMTIAGQAFTVIQAGLGIQVCSTAITPTLASFSATGGSSTINVSTAAGCVWAATSKASWITITSGSGGIGSGSVSYRVAANTTGSSRAGKITIGGKNFSVKQKGA